MSQKKNNTKIRPVAKKKSPAKKFLILFNPSSGRGRALEKKQQLIDLLQAHNISYNLYQTESEQDLRKQVSMAKDYTCLVAAGGDSTFAIVVEEMLRHSLQMPVAIVPVGTSDDIARQWGIVSTQDAVKALADYNLKFVDLMQLSATNAKKQTQNLASIVGQVNIGLGAEVNRLVAKFYSVKLFRKIPESIVGFFVILYLASFGRYHLPLEISSAQQTEKLNCSLLLLTSIQYWVKGLHFSPHSSCDDGLIEAIIIRQAGFISLFKIFLASRNGTHIDLPQVEYWQAKEFQIKTTNAKKFFMQADGEIICTEKSELSLSEFNLRVKKKSLCVIAAEENNSKRKK